MALPYPFFPSPNCESRIGKWNISILVLHYTVIDFSTTKKIFLDPKKKVSAHYVLDIDGSIYQFVDEKKRAWHAGESYFDGIKDINNNSIGIEIVNPGYDINNVKEYPAYPYTENQITALIALSKDIISRYKIKPFYVLGHSDIAPSRKIDPGPHFPWKFLGNHNIGLTPNYDLLDNQDILNEELPASFNKKISTLLSKYGYDMVNLESAKKAFQMHFNQQAYLRKQPFGTYDLSILKSLIDKKNELY